jgi:hypothetical protein
MMTSQTRGVPGPRHVAWRVGRIQGELPRSPRGRPPRWPRPGRRRGRRHRQPHELVPTGGSSAQSVGWLSGTDHAAGAEPSPARLEERSISARWWAPASPGSRGRIRRADGAVDLRGRLHQGGRLLMRPPKRPPMRPRKRPPIRSKLAVVGRAPHRRGGRAPGSSLAGSPVGGHPSSSIGGVAARDGAEMGAQGGMMGIVMGSRWSPDRS